MKAALTVGVFLALLAAGVYLSIQLSLGDEQIAAEPVADFRTVECWFDVPYNRRIRCGHLISPGHSRNFILPVVIIEDGSADSQPDPLVYINGGPGSDNFLAEDDIQHWLDWLDTANLSRDLIVMEFRGTGRAKPQFRCDGYEQYLREALSRDLTNSQDAQALLATVSDCIEAFKRQGYVFEDFSTPVYATDLHRLKQELGYPQWNIIGSSYGTRVALELSRQHPDDVRAMVLDSVYPPGKGGLMHWPQNLADSFAVLWDGCPNSGAECADSKISAEEFWQTVATLNQKPLQVQVSLWRGGWPLDVVVNGHRFVFAAYGALYRASGRSMLLKTIDEIAEGDTSTLTKLMEQSINGDLDPTFNPFTYFMVDCAENYRPDAKEFNSRRQEYPLFETITRNAVALDTCQLFPRLENFTEFSQLQPDSTPVLFLSGALDPVTPSRWVDEIAPLYPNSQLWRMPEISHGVSANSNCVLKSLRSFLDQPTVAHDNRCVSTRPE